MAQPLTAHNGFVQKRQLAGRASGVTCTRRLGGWRDAPAAYGHAPPPSLPSSSIVEYSSQRQMAHLPFPFTGETTLCHQHDGCYRLTNCYRLIDDKYPRHR